MAQCLSVVSNTNRYTANTPECNSAVEKVPEEDKRKRERKKNNKKKHVLKILKCPHMILRNVANSINIIKVAVGQQ